MSTSASTAPTSWKWISSTVVPCTRASASAMRRKTAIARARAAAQGRALEDRRAVRKVRCGGCSDSAVRTFSKRPTASRATRLRLERHLARHHRTREAAQVVEHKARILQIEQRREQHVSGHPGERFDVERVRRCHSRSLCPIAIGASKSRSSWNTTS
jgi:hypothetical protein